jgi:hypothetical protein
MALPQITIKTPNFNNRIVATATIVLIIISLFLAHSYYQHRKEINDQRALIQALQDSTHHWKNKYGEEIASRKIAEGSLQQISQYVNLDSIARSFDVKTKNLQTVYTLIQTSLAQLRASGEPIIVGDWNGKDTENLISLKDFYAKFDSLGKCPPKIRYMEQEFNENPYYKVKARIGDSAYARVETKDSLTIVSAKAYTRHFLKKDWYTQLSVKSENPDAHYKIAGAISIKDSYRTKWFELSVQASICSDPKVFSPQLFAGADAAYHFGKANVFAEYRARPDMIKKGTVWGGVRYTFIRL